MRARVLVVALAAALAAAYLFRDTGGSGAADRSPSLPRTTIPVPADAAPAAPPSAPLRNVFEYADTGGPAAAPDDAAVYAAEDRDEAADSPLPEPSPPVRLVGLMRRGGQARAALVVAGETVVLGAGQSAGGFTVVSIDEEEGVSLRSPDGTVLVLPRAPE